MGKVNAKKKKVKKQSFTEKLHNAPIKKKLTISHGTIIVATFITIVLLLFGMKGIEMYVEHMFEGPVTNSYYIGDIRYALADIPRAINYVRAEGKDKVLDTYKQANEDVDNDWNLIVNAYEMLAKSLTSEENQKLLEDIYLQITNMEDELSTVMAFLRTGQFELSTTYYDNNLKPLLDGIREDVETLDQAIYATSEEYEKNAAMVSYIMIAIGVVVLVGVTAMAMWMTKKVTAMITVPVGEVTKAADLMMQGEMKSYATIQYESDDELGTLANTMRATMFTLSDYIEEISEILVVMAQGDLTKDFRKITDFRGDFASIKESFVIILKEFNNTLNNIQDVSLQVDKGSDEIATAANELAAGSEEQASSVEELTATISTVSSMAEESARESQNAYDKVLVSVHDAEQKREQVEELKAEMGRIKDISGEIANIITAIEEIADQTSLLSLNASIEAARAGEAGRGFAVVADQIGKLAADSAQAAVSTRALIEKTVAEIDKGNSITESTAEAFEVIIREMGTFAETSKHTNETAVEQAEILKQVEEGVNQIAAVTEETAASAQESLATSEELAARSTELDELVKRFKLYRP